MNGSWQVPGKQDLAQTTVSDKSSSGPTFLRFLVFFARVEEGTNFPLRGKGGEKKTDLLLEIYPSLNIETSPSGVFLPSVCLRK